MFSCVCGRFWQCLFRFCCQLLTLQQWQVAVKAAIAANVLADLYVFCLSVSSAVASTVFAHTQTQLSLQIARMSHIYTYTCTYTYVAILTGICPLTDTCRTCFSYAFPRCIGNCCSPRALCCYAVSTECHNFPGVLLLYFGHKPRHLFLAIFGQFLVILI